MKNITPCLWFDTEAEEAAAFYTSLLPGSRIDHVQRSPADNPSTPAGAVIVVEFTLQGQSYMGLNGGPAFPQTPAFSLQVKTEDQQETDRLWNAFLEAGGEESQCGWLKDRWGVSWQITPKRMIELLADPDPGRARRAMEAMMTMRKLDIAALEEAADREGGD